MRNKKLSDSDRMMIMTMRKYKFSTREIADKFNVNPKTVYGVCSVKKKKVNFEITIK